MKDKIKIGFIGVNGRMSQSVISTLLTHKTIGKKVEVIAGVEKENSILLGKRFGEIPGLSSFVELAKIKISGNVMPVIDKVDVWIDFSLPGATLFHLNSLRNHPAAYIIGSTGFTPNQMKVIKKHGNQRPIVISGNYSIGINLMLFVLEKVLAIPMVDSFDIEVNETHHRMKIDAPSGTARMILEKIQKMKKMHNGYLVYDRHKLAGPRKKKEVGITSRRGGGVIGEHEIGFYGDNEVFTLKHSAINREAFSYGVVEAIDFIYQRLKEGRNGLFGIKDVLQLT